MCIGFSDFGRTGLNHSVITMGQASLFLHEIDEYRLPLSFRTVRNRRCSAWSGRFGRTTPYRSRAQVAAPRLIRSSGIFARDVRASPDDRTIALTPGFPDALCCDWVSNDPDEVEAYAEG